MQVIEQTLTHIRIGEPQIVRNLTMTPLLRDEDVSFDYQTLEEAISAGAAEVTEISDQGSVPELHFRNLSDRPVLLMVVKDSSEPFHPTTGEFQEPPPLDNLRGLVPPMVVMSHGSPRLSPLSLWTWPRPKKP